MTDPILTELKKELLRARDLRRESQNTISKLWRVMDNYYKASNNLEQLIDKFGKYIEEKLNG